MSTPLPQTIDTMDDLIQFIFAIAAEPDVLDAISKQLIPTFKEIQPQFFAQLTLDNKDPLEMLDSSTSNLTFFFFFLINENNPFLFFFLLLFPKKYYYN